MTTARLYFAYGSNLDSADLDRWLAAHGSANPLTHPVAPAYLPDHRYAYHFYSAARSGGALDVIGQRGHAVAGMLFELFEEGWEALDHKEGVPFAYERREVKVILGDGSFARATSYRVVPPRYDASGHVAPTDAYHDAVLRGLARHRLDGARALEMARDGEVPRSIVPHVFLYGTLMNRESRASHLEGQGQPASVVPARTRGMLYQVEGCDYPALHIGSGEGGRVAGELCTSDDIESLLARLDPVEGFEGFESTGNLYERTLVKVSAPFDRSARDLIAWTYVMPDAPARGACIASGDWRDRGA